jgi:hypothetical protein
LDKLAARLEISETEYEEILNDPLKYPINPPYCTKEFRFSAEVTTWSKKQKSLWRKQSNLRFWFNLNPTVF